MQDFEASEFEIKNYDMLPNKEGYCGNAIIFVMHETSEGKPDGALIERENIEKFASMLSLKPFVFMNAKMKEIEKGLACITNPPAIRPSNVSEDIWKARILPEHKVIMVVVSSHGNMNSFLTADGKPFLDRTIDTYLNETYCPLMIGKPKIILFNKCRTEGGAVYESISPQSNSPSPVFDSIIMREHENNFNGSSTFSDFLHIYTCSMCTSSLRCRITGSLVLSALPGEYEKYGRNKEFRKFLQIFRTQMIIEVNKKVQNEPNFANVTQCITAEHDSLLGDVYFPQAGLMAGLSDCDSLEDMEVEHAGKIHDPCFQEMESESVITKETKSKHLKSRFMSRMKLYKKAHHTFKPRGSNSRIRSIFFLS
ncbi:hypothetical protein LOD99_10085 [Oopsacas minuta]|uniref:Caspase family p20 domain-containing protein n=1 Tax=Oopsacas minuta TaxID=111878 RepID=A0AAV7KMR6_9METZ|nr:hypothetical protein LOD99_10085 [Oopsacas minuta]